MAVRYLVIASDEDPVAQGVVREWGTPPSTGDLVDGVPIRQLADGVELLRRPRAHIRDDGVDGRLPLRLRGVALVFPSVHRSESGTACTTVHPLGNHGTVAEVGGRPEQLVPAPARLMASALRSLAEATARTGLPATYEATHHGPALSCPAFFVEIAHDPGRPIPESAVRELGRTITSLDEDPSDRIAIGVGGGHYSPRFRDLALQRRWAFGHLVPKYALENGAAATILRSLEATPGAEGVVYARAQDAEQYGGLEGVRRLRENEAPRRETTGSPSASPASGT